MNKEKNNFFYEFEKVCTTRLSDRNKTAHWMRLIDFFRANWEEYVEQENRALLIFKAASKYLSVKSCHTKIGVNNNVNTK